MMWLSMLYTDTDQLTWVKWKTGMILQYGNLTLLSVEELNGGMFPKAQPHDGVKIYGEERWKLHHSDIKIFGINIEVPDIYPILKYPEARRKSKHSQGYIKVNKLAKMDVPTPIPSILEPEAPHDVLDGSLDPSSNGYLPLISDSGAKEILTIDDLDEKFEKLRLKRSKQSKPVGLHAGPTLLDDQIDGDGDMEEIDDVSTDGVIKPSLMKPSCSIRRAPSRERWVALSN